MELYWINSYIDFRFASSLESRYFGAGNAHFWENLHRIWCKFSTIIKQIYAQRSPFIGAIWDEFRGNISTKP